MNAEFSTTLAVVDLMAFFSFEQLATLTSSPLSLIQPFTNSQMESLENFLFGDKGEALSDLGREEALANEAARAAAAATAAATAAHESHVEPLLFFEDRTGGRAADDGEGGEGPSTSAATRVTRRSAAAAAAAAEAAAANADAATTTTTTTLTQTAAAAAGVSAHRSSSAAARPPAPSSAAWSDPYVETAVVDLASGAARWRKLRNDDEGERQNVPVDGGEFERRLRRRVAASSGSRARAWASRAKAEAAAAAKRRSKEEEDGGPATPDVLASGASLLAAGPSSSSYAASAAATAAGSSRLEVSRLPDANAADASDAVVSSVDFHASGQLLLTAGMDKRLRFFQADGAKNAKLQSLFLRDMPIRQAAFCGSSGNLALAVGRRPFLYVFDLGSGRAEKVQKPLGREERTFEAFAVSKGVNGGSGSGSGGGGSGDLVALLGNRGCIPLLSLRSRCLAGELRTAGGTVRAAVFAPNGDENVLFATGGDGVVHSWDLRTRRCLGRASDEGAVRGTALACGGGWLAAGSDSGVVNVYGRGEGGTLLSSKRAVVGHVSFDDDDDDDEEQGNKGPISSPLRSPAQASRPAPARSLLTLTTTVDTLAFSPGGELLVMASRMRRDALRVCSGKDLKVYANWPSSRTPLGHVHCAAFSPGGGMLAIGNAKGKCLLYRINHLPVV